MTVGSCSSTFESDEVGDGLCIEVVLYIRRKKMNVLHAQTLGRSDGYFACNANKENFTSYLWRNDLELHNSKKGQGHVARIYKE